MASSKQTMQKAKGFTLIELLVVISIIALLLSILMPSLGRVKSAAKKVVCRVNARSLILGTLLYAEENDGRFIHYNSTALYLHYLSPYLDDIDQTRYCPETQIGENPPHNFIFGFGNYGAARYAWCWKYTTPYEYGSYLYNGWLYLYDTPSEQGPEYYITSKNIPHPRQTPCFADAIWVDAWPYDRDEPDANLDLFLGAGNSSSGSMNRLLTNRHGKDTNVSFVDGHVASLELPELWTLRWSRTFDPRSLSELPEIPPLP